MEDAAKEVVSEIDRKIKDAVTIALIQGKVESHERRIGGLEAFRWWLVGGLAASSLGSWGTLIVFLVERSVKQ